MNRYDLGIGIGAEMLMDRSTSSNGSKSAEHRGRGQVVSLNAWKSKKEQKARQVERRRRRQQRSLLRVFAMTFLGLEGLAVASSWIPSPYQHHSIIVAWALGVITGIAGLWLNIQVDRRAGQILTWSSVGLVLSLIPGFFRLPV